MHINCRDRNRLAMQKDLIGAAALGVTSVVVTRGAKIPHGNKMGVRNVYDTPALEFMTYIQGMKHDESMPLASDFMIGAHAELFEPDTDWTPKNLLRKCDAGANFVQLQLCFDLAVAKSYMARIVAAKLTHRVSFMMALSPLPSAEVARWVRDNVKGALVPDAIIRQLDRAPDPEREGIRLCAELLRELTRIPGVSGANLLALGSLEAIPAAVEASGVRLA
jgi:methylenetetrahydrofolate reductase (NADPH)